MTTDLSPTAKQVLRNLRDGRPIWHGVQTMVPGAGIPSVVTSLRKRGLIMEDLVNGGLRLTVNGAAVIGKI